MKRFSNLFLMIFAIVISFIGCSDNDVHEAYQPKGVIAATTDVTVKLENITAGDSDDVLCPNSMIDFRLLISNAMQRSIEFSILRASVYQKNGNLIGTVVNEDPMAKWTEMVLTTQNGEEFRGIVNPNENITLFGHVGFNWYGFVTTKISYYSEVEVKIGSLKDTLVGPMQTDFWRHTECGMEDAGPSAP